MRRGGLSHAAEARSESRHNTNVGDEGGFAPNLASTDEALDFVMKAIEKAGYTPATTSMLALDAAATEFYKDGKYVSREGETWMPTAWSNLRRLCARYPDLSRSRTRMAEDDWDGWHALTEPIGDKVQLVGDDLFVTNPAAARGHRQGRGQFHPGQGQPDRHADRDAGSRRHGARAATPR